MATEDRSLSAPSAESTPVTIEFRSNWTQAPSGSLVRGDKAVLKFDPSRAGTCRASANSEWSTTAHYRINGGAVGSIEAAGYSPSNGKASREIALTHVGDLEVWFETTNRFGCQSWDSNFGKNYHFVIASPTNEPEWVGNGASVISRSTCANGEPCDSDLVPLQQWFRFDTWARERAAITNVYFEVWKAGTTDFDNSKLWQQIDVQVHHRPAGYGPFQTRYVDFDTRRGNNARYAFSLRDIDLLAVRNGSSVITKSDCPTFPLALSPDGQYVEATAEFYITVNGVDYRPTTGGTFKGKFTDYIGRYEVCFTP